jgi:protein CMS1
VLDGSHMDRKRRGIFDMKDTHVPLMKLLARPELRDRYGSGGSGSKRLEILVF